MLESQQQIQNLLNSQSFPNQTPNTSFLEHPIEEKSELEKRLEVCCEMAHDRGGTSTQKVCFMKSM